MSSNELFSDESGAPEGASGTPTPRRTAKVSKHSTGRKLGAKGVGRLTLGLILLIGTFVGLTVEAVITAAPAFAAQATTCIDPASGGTATTFHAGVTNSSYTVECEEETGISGTSAYPTITVATDTLPADGSPTLATGSACTTTTSGTGATEEYIEECAFKDSATAADESATPYTATFTSTPGAFTGSTLTPTTSGTLSVTINAPTVTCIDPASGGTAATFHEGLTSSYTVECEEQSGISSVTAYPTTAAVATDTLPVDSNPTFATSTSSSPACTTGTSGSGTTEEYILECPFSATPTAADTGTYAATFSATGAGGVGTATSGSLNITVSAVTVSCIDPASGGTASTFYEGSANSYTVECEAQSGISGVTAYPSSVAIASGSLPADGNPSFATSTSSSPACTTGTSGSGATEEYILECALTDTPTSADAGSYPLTFTATGPGGIGSTTSGTLTVTVAQPSTTCSTPAAGGTSVSWVDGTAESETIICYSQGFAAANAGDYPSSITLNSGTLPSDASEATSTSSSPACTTATSGSGTATEYELECKVTETPVYADNGTYHLTFLATGGANGAPNAVSGTLTVTISQPAPSWATSGSTDGNYFSAVKGVPFCYDLEVSAGQAGPSGTNPGTTASLPLTSLTAGTTPANIANYRIQDVNLTTGTAQICGTNNNTVASAPVTMAPVATNSGGSSTDSIATWSQNECTWSSSGATVSMFDTNQDLETAGSQSAFGQPISGGVTAGSTKDIPTCPGGVGVSADGGLGTAWTMNTANPLPTPTDTNPSAALGDLPSSNLDLTSASSGSAGGCWGAVNILASTSTDTFGSGSTASMELPSSWVNGGDCTYGGLGSNSAGGNTDKAGGTNGGQPTTGDANCPPTQADVNAGLVDCTVVISSGNDENGSTNYSSLDLFYNGQPVPQTPTAALSSGTVLAGDSVSVTGGTNWWGANSGAPNAGPYGDFQNNASNFYPVSAPQVLIGTSPATAVPVTNSTVAIGADAYACTGAESTTVAPNPCTLTVGQPTGTFQVPSGLAPGAYNIYIEESNTTPLPGNGPNDAYQTARGTSLGTVLSTTPLDVEGVMVVKTSTTAYTDGGYSKAGDTINYSYAVTNQGPDTVTNITVNDNKIPSVDITCPSSSLAGGTSETCTGTYTVTQADVDNGSVTNTATVSATSPSNEVLTSAPSSVTVNASDATSSLSLVKSTTSTGYGAAGNTIPYSYLVTNTGTTTESNIAVSDNLIANVSCPSSSLAGGASEICTATYTVTQADVDNGSVTNTATASGTNPASTTEHSNSSTVTVLASNAVSSLSLTKSTTSTGYGAAGNTIPYSYLVTNTGTTTESGVGVTDSLIATVNCPDSSLAPGASETCTGSYTVTQVDVDNGSVTNTATANATNPYANAISSNSSSVTVEASQATSTLSLAKSTTSTGYGSAGEIIPYTYLVTNTGTTTESGVGVSDNKVASVSCPDPTLAPAASETCTGSYTVTQADVDRGYVTNTATASATNPQSVTITSGPSSVTVDATQATSSLSLSKSTTSDGYGTAGTVLNYSYLLTNSGTTTLSAVGVTDNLVSDVNCPDSSLAPGASETCTGSYTVTQADVDAGSVTNTAFATATDVDSSTVKSGSSTVVVEASLATSSLSIVKSTNSSGYGAAGDVIDYSYLVTNTGTTDLSAVGVNDNLVSNVSCPDSSLAPGASETCTGSYTVTQANVDAGSVTNIASASGLAPPDSTPVTSGSSSLTVDASNATAGLSIVKSTNSSGYGAVGNVIAYSYDVTNSGTTTLSGVGVTDNLIANVSCPDSSLAPGASETCTGSYTVTQADVDHGSVTNTASASAVSPPNSTPVSSGNSSVTVDASLATTSLSIDKSTTSTGYGAAGNVINYTYDVTNSGTTTLSGVGVTDNLIANVSCPDSSLAPGASETCTGSYTVTQADVDHGSVTNTATANATDPHSNAVSSGSSAVTVLASQATSTLSLSKSSTSTGYGAAGNTIGYKYVVTNTGTTTESTVGVTDNKVATVSCPSGTLAPGASETCTGSYTVTQADVNAGSVTNTATAHAKNPQAVAVTSASSSVTVLASLATSKLTVTEASTNSSFHAAGNVLHYTFVVKNTGTTTLSGVNVTDNKATSLSCPNSSLAPAASETCTGSYTVTQADVSAGKVVNTAVAHATNPHAVTENSASSTVTIDVTGLRITNASLPAGTRNVSYSAQLTAAGGKSPYTFKRLSGPLPPNLQMSTAGKISGKPTTAGSYVMSFEVLDSSSPQVVATATFTITIST